MDAAKKVIVMVCAACGGQWFPAHWYALGKCPSCSHPSGEEKPVVHK